MLSRHRPIGTGQPVPIWHNVRWWKKEHYAKDARMIDRHHTDQRPFLTVVKWPDGFQREDVAQLIAEWSGLIEFIRYDRTGALYEHAGFGNMAADAKNRQAAFFIRQLLGA